MDANEKKPGFNFFWPALTSVENAEHKIGGVSNGDRLRLSPSLQRSSPFRVGNASKYIICWDNNTE